MLTDYLGSLNEDLIKDNFVIVYEVDSVTSSVVNCSWQSFFLGYLFSKIFCRCTFSYLEQILL